MVQNRLWSGAAGALATALFGAGAAADQVAFTFSDPLASGHRTTPAVRGWSGMTNTGVAIAHGSPSVTGLFWDAATTPDAPHLDLTWLPMGELTFLVPESFFTVESEEVGFAGVSRPTSGGVQDLGVVVPLPPAAWAGLVCLAGLAGSRALRRRAGRA